VYRCRVDTRRGLPIGSRCPPWSSDSFPLKLDEGEPIEKTLRPADPYLFNDANDYASDIHIGDTLGRIYRVKAARKLLRQYQRIYKDEIEQWKKV
jgi:hypothetical protein